MNPRTGLVDRRPWPATGMATLDRNRSLYHVEEITLSCFIAAFNLVSFLHFFVSRRHCSGRGACLHVASSGTEETFRGAKCDHSKRGDGEFPSRVHGRAWRRFWFDDAERRGGRGDEMALGWAEKRPLGEKGRFFENVITDSHLLSFLGGRDCSNAVRGKEKRQRCRGRPDLVGRGASSTVGRGSGRLRRARRKALSWGGIRDWE